MSLSHSHRSGVSVCWVVLTMLFVSCSNVHFSHVFGFNYLMTTTAQDGSRHILDILADICTVGWTGDVSSIFVVQSVSYSEGWLTSDFPRLKQAPLVNSSQCHSASCGERKEIKAQGPQKNNQDEVHMKKHLGPCQNKTTPALISGKITNCLVDLMSEIALW